MMLLTLLPVTALASTATATTPRLRAYTINESQMDSVFMKTVFFAGDVITFTPTAAAWSPGNYVCTPFAGIAEIKEQYNGAISKITITSPSSVTFYYRGAGPTGVSTGEATRKVRVTYL
ncbi:MAG: hypothetical protein GX838_01120 [Clostridiaceae bacterium]|nr:hypothetical protein [Clostridiaceae bacterium]